MASEIRGFELSEYNLYFKDELGTYEYMDESGMDMNMEV